MGKRDYKQIWNDFENNWLNIDSNLLDVTQTGKHVNFDIQEAIIPGCTDPGAENYFIFATEDDGSCIVNIKESTKPAFDFIFYPNPSNGDVYLNFNQNQSPIKVIEVFDSAGQLILSKNSRYQMVYLNMQAISKGIYFIKVINDDRTTVKKLALN